MEGFGQTETTMVIGNLMGASHKIGSMGKASPLYDILLLDSDGNEVPVGQTGEICIRTSERVPCGLFLGVDAGRKGCTDHGGERNRLQVFN
jgi:acetyl-CoA synthetase